VGLHERLGLAQVGHFTAVGRKLDRWLDVGHWQKVLQA
jgi:L-amino acid N-acyltransferase YncA